MAPQQGMVLDTLVDPTQKTHEVTWAAENAQGRSERRFHSVVGQNLGL